MSKRDRKRGANAPRAHDTCVDPNLYFSDERSSTGQRRKTEQLRIAIRRALITALDCDVDDPRLDGLHVHDVLAEPGGSFAALFTTSSGPSLDAVQARLRAATPVFRNALATTLARKRVPQVSLHVVPAVGREVDDE